MEELKQENIPLDFKWYERMSKLIIEDYTFLEGDSNVRKKEEEEFLKGKIDNPVLDYPKIKIDELNDREQKLLELKEDVLREEQNETVKQTYRWKINEMIATVRMLKCSAEGNDKRFARYNKFIYGEPSLDVFVYELQKRKKRVDKFLTSEDEGRKQAAQELKNLINFDVLKQIDNSEIKPVFVEEPQKDESIITATEAKAYFDDAIKALNIPNWQVVIDESGNKTNFSADQATKTVFVPNDEQLFKRSSLLDKTKIIALIAHELGVHALRREKGERSKMQLLGVGLDRYVKGEEGLATHKQQEVEGTDDYSGELGHFSLSLAMGLDGKKRNFREVFEIMRRFQILLKKESVDRDSVSSANAFRQCVRIFRGTTSRTRGVVYSKDMVYREGNIGIWDLVNTDSDEQHRFMVGKYDPTNPRHIYILDQLGISEKDLSELES